MQVIDNFLSEEEYNDLKSRILGDCMDWYWNEGVVYEDDGLFQLTHTIFDVPKDQKSNLFYHCKSILNKLGGAVFRIKANLTTKTNKPVYTGYHTDFTEDEFVGQTGIYYVNTNNGWTEFASGVKVNSIANRMVIFDSKYEHAGVTSTDTNRRVVINFNFQ
tara:strand:- start:523 stop:1005 length:483 start_codon:yes stop_codon:yes gene_type:complete